MRSHPQKTITYREAGLPSITGHYSGGMESTVYYMDGGAFRFLGNVCAGVSIGAHYIPGYDQAGFDFDAARCSPIYGNSETVQPASVCVNYFIKAR